MLAGVRVMGGSPRRTPAPPGGPRYAPGGVQQVEVCVAAVDNPLVLMPCCSFQTDDHTRVVLSQVDGAPGSDYINASYIDVSPHHPVPGPASQAHRQCLGSE